jgi:hypothetical protein
MAKTIYLKDGSTEILFSDNDFQKLICDKLGREAEQEVIELMEKADYNKEKVNTDLGSYEASLDEMNCCLNDVLDSLDNMRKFLEGKRIDKEKLKDMIDSIERQINNYI